MRCLLRKVFFLRICLFLEPIAFAEVKSTDNWRKDGRTRGRTDAFPKNLFCKTPCRERNPLKKE